MHALIAMGILYFWFRGHWFARILVFLFTIPALFFLTVGKVPDTMFAAIPYLISLPIMAWLVAGLPVYLQRRKVPFLPQSRLRLIPGD